MKLIGLLIVVLQRLTEDVIEKDSALGLAYLLALPNVSSGHYFHHILCVPESKGCKCR